MCQFVENLDITIELRMELFINVCCVELMLFPVCRSALNSVQQLRMLIDGSPVEYTKIIHPFSEVCTQVAYNIYVCV